MVLSDEEERTAWVVDRCPVPTGFHRLVLDGEGKLRPGKDIHRQYWL